MPGRLSKTTRMCSPAKQTSHKVLATLRDDGSSLYHPLMPPSVEWGPYPRPLLPQVGTTRPFFAGKLLRTSPMRQPCTLHDSIQML